MKLILTNDDGIDAPGIEILEEVLRGAGQLIVVAPAREQSGVSHQVTTHAPIRVERIAERRYRVEGTPADCARIALTHIAPDAVWLCAGINAGANLGADIYTSGTVAAAREASMLGCRALAVSQYIARNQPLDWDRTREQASTVLPRVMARTLEKGQFWNINFPHLPEKTPELSFCDLDISPHSFCYHQEGDELIYSADFHARPRQPGRDVETCFSGSVSVTRLCVGSSRRS